MKTAEYLLTEIPLRELNIEDRLREATKGYYEWWRGGKHQLTIMTDGEDIIYSEGDIVKLHFDNDRWVLATD